MTQEIVRSIAILGGGTAGWMTAAALARSLNHAVAITLVESEDIGTVGVGEATIPSILRFNELLGLDENEFIRETMGTFKLGIEYVDWPALGHRYMHGFGRLRNDVQLAPFEQIWQRLRRAGLAEDLPAYSVTKSAAYAGKFLRPRHDVPDSPLADIAYAFHFDASLYARYLRGYAERRGVQRIDGMVAAVQRSEPAGDVQALVLADGRRIEADFFVDCSGFRSRIIGQKFGIGFEDWSRWLPCDSAVAVPSEFTRPLLPYTRATARDAGWQWRIPLQHRMGNGYVYCSRYIDHEDASRTLLNHLGATALGEPRRLSFKAGVRAKAWVRNCVAVGLSGGFLEPLESTSIHLIQSAIGKLLTFMPSRTPSEADIAEYNRLVKHEYEHLRDFIVLHYHATTRRDTPFWQYCQSMDIPDSLKTKIDLFRQHGRLYEEPNELFAHGNWFQVMHGQGLAPSSYHPIVDVIAAEELSAYFKKIRTAVEQCLDYMPTHEEFISKNCRAPNGLLQA